MKQNTQNRTYITIKIHKRNTKNFFKFIYYTDIIYKMYKDKLQNCSCNHFHCIGTYRQVEKNRLTKNRGGNNGREK